MNILFIADELSYRGTPRFLFVCACVAKAAGHKVLVWGLHEGGYTVTLCQENDIAVLTGETRLSDALAFTPGLIHIHRGGGPDSFQFQILRKLKKASACRILETNVFGIVDFTPHSPIDLHTHISHWDLWRWRRWLWPFRSPGIYLPYCLDTESLKPTVSDFRSKHAIPDTAFLIGRLGKTDWGVVLETLRIAMSVRRNIWFATVDDYSNTENPLCSLPEEAQKRLVTIPRLNGAAELSRFYSACDITLNFSPIGESFGYVVAESMSCGTPVIALSKPRNDNAQIEIAALECGGFPVVDATSAASVILELVNDKTKLEAARSKCRASIERFYSIQTQASRILRTYKLLASSQKKGVALEQLFANSGFETHYPQTNIFRQLAAVRGGLPSLFERFKMCLAYTLPNALRHHLWSLLK